MGRAYFTALAAAGAFGLATANRGAGSCPAGSGHKPHAVQNPPPVPADPSLAQGQGRGGSPIQSARAPIKGSNGLSTRVTMGGPTGLFDADESAIVIHQNPDTNQTVRRVRA